MHYSKNQSWEQLQTWYENKPLGIHKIENKIKEISVAANLSQIYTNHCIRATTTTILSNAGVENRKIMSVTGHKNEGSLQSYVKQPTSAQRAEMCNILHTFGKLNENQVEMKAIENNPMELKAIEGKQEKMQRSVIVQNRKENYEVDNSSAIFSGANFNGQTTINVQINQK